MLRIMLRIMLNVFNMLNHLLTNISYTAIQTEGQWNLIDSAVEPEHLLKSLKQLFWRSTDVT